ncbi:MAG: carboxylesterase family protein [Bacteroidia bacterium]|nr:carboxylesterase family protein [Bacteroidia bacterium]
MKFYIFGALFLLLPITTSAQNFTDPVYQIKTESNLTYGSATDFAGNVRTLVMDISYPTNDTAPTCGRPLMVMVHGGAFMAGNQNSASVGSLRTDFAKRGYTTASVTYRLGLFQTNRNVHCNASSFGIEWDCLNMTDSSEWYRAYYRGVQDVRGAIRYLVKNAAKYNIDPQNVFVVGESAGGFIALGVGYMDDTSEVLGNLIGSMNDVKPPNNIYQSPCVVKYNLDTSIASMKYKRPELGSLNGTLNPLSGKTYTLQGVGNFYGAVFNNLFKSTTNNPPALYMFHQPNDLIVPYSSAKVFAGYNACATGFPFSCAGIINRPVIWGSKGIQAFIDSAAVGGGVAPRYRFDKTSNTANCAIQLADPSKAGHRIDNYAMRSRNMAHFFADEIEPCTNSGLVEESFNNAHRVYPNPAESIGSIRISGSFNSGDRVEIHDALGRLFLQHTVMKSSQEVQLNETNGVPPGVYTISVRSIDTKWVQKLILSTN